MNYTCTAAKLFGTLGYNNIIRVKFTELKTSINDNNDNDNDKQLGLTAKADQPDHKKIQYTNNKTDNAAVQKCDTS